MTGPLLTLLNARSLAAYTAAGYWGDETLYAIAARHARTTPDSFAVRDRHRRLTYAALVEAADRLAAAWPRMVMRPGQRVAVWLPSRVETAIALLACSRNGYVCCPSLHRDHTAGEIVALVDRMRAAALIAAARLRRRCRPARHFRRARRSRFSPLDLPRSVRPTARRSRTCPDRAAEVHHRAAIPTRSCICPSPPARPEHRKASCTATTPCSPRRG